ncbi:glycosyltransferase [Terasakiella sp. SH-1]|uniref:glycosyltransferase n=1 Tax=Terasakiella sp. SH-1 TaxID=2560057 RepID=UPI001073A942|nr:glycosyltransferase [Terasakiella sp. SH-1]
MTTSFEQKKIAVVLPCYNEGNAIADVVASFKRALPSAKIYVFDNNSTDNTAVEAQNAGAQVITERQQGKGNVVRRIFAEVDADCYIMADGDGTYEAAAAPQLAKALFDQKLDMVVGCRKSVEGEMTYRAGHAFGNKLLTGIAQTVFGRGFTDMLTGYRAFSRRFAKSFPILSSGFEIETEITIHCLSLNLPASEIQTKYYERAEGTESKLNTYRDGWRILMTILRLFRDAKPLIFFSLTALILAILSIGLAVPLISEFLNTGLVTRLPTAVLCTGLMLSALMSITCGIILDSIARQRLENKKIAYLQHSQGEF